MMSVSYSRIFFSKLIINFLFMSQAFVYFEGRIVDRCLEIAYVHMRLWSTHLG